MPVLWVQIFFGPPGKPPFSPKYLIGQFCFTDSYSSSSFLLLSLVNELCTHLIHLINITSLPAVSLRWVPSHWDTMMKPDFRKGSC